MRDLPSLPGVFLERRAFLKLSFGALAGLVVGCRSRDAFLASAAPLTLDGLLETIHPWGEKLVREGGDEEAYLRRVSALLPHVEPQAPGTFHDAPYGSAFQCYKVPVMMFQFQIVPNGVMPWHDHRRFISALVGLEGEMAVTSYEALDGDPGLPLDRPFLIRRSGMDRVGVGSVSSVASRRGYIHALKAGPRGVRFLDVITAYGKEADAHFMDAKPLPGKPEGILEARWVS